MDHAVACRQEQRERPRVAVRAADRPGDLGWVVMAHGELYAAELGWDAGFEAMVARIVADYAAGRDRTREAAWIAEVDRRVGCILCVADDATTARLRTLLVDPSARGRGVGGRLVRTCLRFARSAGYRRVVLWTTDGLAPARHLYEKAGFVLVREERQHSFGHELVGQDWVLDLTPPGATTARDPAGR
jgi:GNAT superfamily N-acetyltransferase